MKQTLNDYLHNAGVPDYCLKEYKAGRWSRIRKYVWDYVILRDKSCRSCGSTKTRTIDHIIPKSQGGSWYRPENLQLLCYRCNRMKRDRVINKLNHE